MTTYILIFAFWAGTLSKGDSSSMISQEFTTKEACESAGNAAKSKFSTLMKTAAYVCVPK